MHMIEENLFRSLPRPTQINFNPEEDEPYLDPEYEHIGQRLYYRYLTPPTQYMYFQSQIKH
jgi:hypothetical protein